MLPMPSLHSGRTLTAFVPPSLRSVQVALRATRGHSYRATVHHHLDASFQPLARHCASTRSLATSPTRDWGASTMHSASSSTHPPSPLRFHTFDVTDQVFVEREHTLALVNLKPIVPLHVLVVPRHPYKSIDDIPRTKEGRAQLHELFETVQDVAHVCRSLTGAKACTIAIQDGVEAGQSVPHVHVHILPRRTGDFVPKDSIYDHLEAFGLGLHKAMTGAAAAAKEEGGAQSDKDTFIAPDSEDRTPRTASEMKSEAEWLRREFSRITTGGA